MLKKKRRIFYPFLIGIYAAVELVNVNISQMELSAGFRSVAVTVVFSLASYALFYWQIKSEHKAALMSAWFMLFFFAYGHLYGALEGKSVLGVVLGRHRFFFPFWLVVFAVGGWWIYKNAHRLEGLSKILNVVSILLLVIPLVQIGVFEWQRHAHDLTEHPSSPVQEGLTPATSQLPDIYYIILDGYPRQDVLLKYHHFDNSQFIQEMETIGFFIPHCSQSNYAATDLSLASSLNMTYLEGINPNVQQINYPDSIIHSRTRQILEGFGYKIVSIDSGIWFTVFNDADYNINQNRSVLGSFLDIKRLSEFEVVFLRTTLLRLVDESKAAWLGSILQNPRMEAYERILFEFDQIESVPSLPGPKFVFVHIVAPHSFPFIFNAEGEFEVSSSIDPALGNVLRYLNWRTLEAVRAIIAKSGNPPVIIIQGDHGIDTEARLAIFNAIYFPNGGNEVLYPTLSPVNTFRLVFNTYFGRDFPLLPDISYFSAYEDYYNFSEVTYPCTH